MDKELNKAMDDLYDAYEDAVQCEFIHKPVSYALYETWKKWNEKELPRYTGT